MVRTRDRTRALSDKLLEGPAMFDPGVRARSSGGERRLLDKAALSDDTRAKSGAMQESLTTMDSERTIEFEFVRATENAALNVVPWLGRGEKEKADAAACDAMNGVFDLVDIAGEVVIGEGAKDNAPGLFLGDKLGTWRPGSPRFDVAVDPIDGTTNLANGLPNSISVMAASQRQADGPPAMRSIPSFYSMKVAYAPEVVKALQEGLPPIGIDDPLESILRRVAEALGKACRTWLS